MLLLLRSGSHGAVTLVCEGCILVVGMSIATIHIAIIVAAYASCPLGIIPAGTAAAVHLLFQIYIVIVVTPWITGPCCIF